MTRYLNPLLELENLTWGAQRRADMLRLAVRGLGGRGCTELEHESFQLELMRLDDDLMGLAGAAKQVRDVEDDEDPEDESRIEELERDLAASRREQERLLEQAVTRAQRLGDVCRILGHQADSDAVEVARTVRQELDAARDQRDDARRQLERAQVELADMTRTAETYLKTILELRRVSASLGAA